MQAACRLSVDRAALTLARADRVDPGGCLADERDELPDLGDRAEVGLDPIEGVLPGPPFLVEDPERLAQGEDRLLAEPRAAKADRVQAGDAVIALLEYERGDVLRGRSQAAEHGQP